MAAAALFVSLLVVLTLTQDCVLGQHRHKVENDPFGGIRYSHSRVASSGEPRKPPPSSNRTSTSGAAYRRPVTATTTSTTDSPRPRGRWDAYTTTTTPAPPGTTWDTYTPRPRTHYASYTATTTTTTTTTTPRPSNYREDPYSPGYNPNVNEHDTAKPSRRRKLKQGGGDNRESPDDDESVAERKRQWRYRYGSWKKDNGAQASNRLRAIDSGKYGIEEGSYFERTNTTTAAPVVEDRTGVFDWEATKKPHHHKKHHHNRHHTTTTSTSTTTATPDYYSQRYRSPSRDRSDSYAAFESRGFSYAHPSSTASPSTSTTVDPYDEQPVTRSTLRPYRRRATTTRAPDAVVATASSYTSRRHLSPLAVSAVGAPSSGSATYHQKLRKKPTPAVQHRSSESVSYVAGSYFPMTAGNAVSGSSGRVTAARKPNTGFAARPRSSYAPDPVTPSPVPAPVYPTVRIHYYPDPVDHRRVSPTDGRVTHTDDRDSRVTHSDNRDSRTGRRTTDDDDYGDDYSHPFASLGSSACDQGSCYPATGNLLVGREDRLTSTSTCGLYKPERFCIVSHLQDRKKCFFCDSTQKNKPKNSHRIENIVSKPSKRKENWWQSENGVEKVSIQLDLEAEFHFTHLIITFKTFRPAAMLIERSFDFGRTWKVYKYFAYDCQETFPNVPKSPSRRITDVVCEARYSAVAPSTEGEVIFRVLNPNIHIDDPYSEEVQNLLKMTNLRLNFTKLHTLGDDLVDNREEIKEKYYYAIYDLVVRGSCSCYGHASRCVELPGVPPRPDMVHGRCECTHFTKGLNCEQCEDFYNDLPWRPAFGRSSNACKRCNCNNHATKCHFDPAVYEATGRISGGVCDDCEHNTMGTNCEQCRPFFYHDPSLRSDDPEACQPCDCDPRGSLDEGICDGITDAKYGVEAGRCHCKKNCEGSRCDRCKNGFWNFQSSNVDGCEACTCDAKGTIENQGCNQHTGECTCKRYVIGRDCNQCAAEFWGLSEERDGCKACDCDPGGAKDNSCDVITGQCRCRPHVTGRRCDTPEQGYFAGFLNYLTYEGELSHGSGNTQVVVREPYGDRETTWSGLGFVRVYEDSFLEFDVDNIQQGMEYDLVIRYEPQVTAPWENVRVTVERPGPTDSRGVCANTTPQDDILQVSLPPGNRVVIAQPAICLEAKKHYKIRLEFKRYDTRTSSPTATLLIDSIALIPKADSIPFFQTSQVSVYRRQEYERFRCHTAYLTVVKPPLADVCKQYLFSIGVYTIGEATECNCDLTGSVSSICDSLGGQCQCKPNVVGRRCDRCAPGTYGFSPSGCIACDCNSVGALDNFCNVTSGKCNCRPNTYGRQCDECRPGYWNYPNCRPCECNGHTDRCDPRTGSCIDCRDYTGGNHCDVCESGFYGDPRSGHSIPCRPCLCPGIAGEGHNFGATCGLDPRTQNVACNCEEGYAGERCDRCANNYYGNPEVAGGQCQPCQCNNNIDITRPANCDAKSGECKNCLFNTEGFFCERCKPGHWGDAINQNCIECTCDILGTDISINGGYCDPLNGQCPCLPNVMGLNCDRCLPNHWKLASGEGCEACACDSLGSYSEQCNEFDGQCKCKPGFGGRKCDECQSTFWGNPRVRCQPCECDQSGSETLQCHRNNGTCVCRLGIGGDKCNQCARGYTGQAPYCNPCGECFDNWDRIIAELKGDTMRLIDEAKAIKRTGVTGVYTDQFADMEKKLDEVRDLLAQANVTNADIESLQQLVDELRQNLTRSNDQLRDLDDTIDNTTGRIYDANQQLASLQTSAKRLQEDAQGLENNATALQEENVEGALNITREAWRKSRGAQAKVDDAGDKIKESERERRRTENLIDQAQAAFDRTFAENEKALDDAAAKIADMEGQIPDINQDVCDGRGDPCNALCGGAGCGKCGGTSCNQGAVTKAGNALELARQADGILREKDAKASDLLNDISKAKRQSDEARDEAQKAYDRALAARNRSGDVKADVEELLGKITDFLDDDSAKPQEIRIKAEETLAKDIKLKPEEITALAKQINNAIAGLTNIDDILAATNKNLSAAEGLKKRADQAKKDAEDVFDTAKKVGGALDDAKEAQDKAQAAIDKANDDINTAESDLAQIDSETSAGQDVADKSEDDLADLKNRLNDLKKKFVENDIAVQKAGQESRSADAVADKAKKAADELEGKYGDVNKALDNKAKASGDAKDRAEKLRERADALAQNATDKLAELNGMEIEFNVHETRLRDLSKELDELSMRLMQYQGDIDKRAKYYFECNP